MKINELLKPNEGFNLNEVQVVGNRPRCHILDSQVWMISSLPLPSQLVDMPLVFTHTFPGVVMSPSLADGNMPFSSAFPGWGKTWETELSILCGSTPNRRPPQLSFQHCSGSSLLHLVNPTLLPTCREIMMSERCSLTFAALFHGKNFKPKWQSILLGKSM